MSPKNINEEIPGDAIRVFRSKGIIRFGIAISGIIIFCVGVFLLYEIRGARFNPGIWVITLALLVLGLSYLLGRMKYTVDSEGIGQVLLSGQKFCRWDQIAEIVDRRTKQGTVSSRSCVLLQKNGAQMEIGDLAIDYQAITALIRQRAESRGIPWKEEKIVK